MKQRPNGWRVQHVTWWVSVVVVGLGLMLAGCSVPFARQTTQVEGGSAPRTSLHVNAFPHQPLTHDINQATHARGGSLSAQVLYLRAFYPLDLPTFDQTVTDPAKAAALYTAVRALPPFPKGVYYCPNDSGNTYDLTFLRGQTPTSWAIVHPGGCEEVELPNGDVRWAFGQNHFWAALATALGVPQSTLFLGPLPSGSSAPQADPNQP